MVRRRFLTEDGKEFVVQRASTRGLKKYSDIANEIGVRERQLHNILAGTVALSTQVKGALQTKLGFTEGELDKMTMSTPSLRRHFAAGASGSSTILRGIDAYYMEMLERTLDPKNVIVDSRISELLLKLPTEGGTESLGAITPTLAECVTVTELAWFRNQNEKDKLFPGLFDYNHFFHLACVIRFHQSASDDPEVLLYNRGSLKYEHAPGDSLIWYTNYMYHGLGHVSLMERWIQAVRERLPNAGAMMTAGQFPLLLQLMRSRIDVRDFQISTVFPLGVITNSQRTETCRRVYTQYVFVVDLYTDQAIETSDVLSSIPCNGVRLRVRRQGSLTAEDFKRDDGEHPVADILALRALQKPQTAIFQEQRGHFRRGFRLF